ncbi:phosphate ABC transporter permease PstA [Spirulina sp. 06S082]|uniref:phosphate ABC transporter permease PstA n=1 Tax=Spirulina sp. 06S082 TaxID=3110248 RepID=UPI002B2070CD|nr:phosphate ABC transporter permease PstA [Spirulina sp. 06S082]MEA5472293.1 phosphate ABC transporter permease PstA [Spirulina sp. 06S082]
MINKFRPFSFSLKQRDKIAYKDIFLALLVWSTAFFVTGVFLWILFDIFWHGSRQISWAFLTGKTLDSGRTGGIAPILVSTLLLLGICLVVALPLGLGTAILLAEFTPTDHWFGRLIRFSLDILAGVPSIVFGLFGNAFFSIVLGLGFSLFSGGLTLACMVLPILIRSIEKGLRGVPNDYRLSAASLGLSRTATLTKLLLPAAVPSVVAGLILGIGRAMAETAALIYTSGNVYRMPESLFDSGRSLSLHIYDLSMNVPGGDDNAYASALVLVFLLLAIDTTAIWITEKLLREKIQN